MRIVSPMPTGNGAYVAHKLLEQAIPGYLVRGYSPWWSLLPLVLPVFGQASGVELIHTALDYAGFFRRRKVPLVATAHNYVLDAFMIPYSSPLQRLHYATDLRLFTWLSLAAADRVTAVSQYLADKLNAAYGIRAAVIYNGVDEQRFTPRSGSREPGPLRVLFCGNLSRRKRAGLIPALARGLGPRFEIHYTTGLAGGRPLPDLGNRAARLVCRGGVSPDLMPEVYRSVDLLFMPSVREGFGLCVAEAMACGLPVVATRTSAIPELVEAQRGGFLCDVDDVHGFAKSICELADDPEQRRLMGQFNRSRVEERFTQSRMIGQYRTLFESVLAS